MIIEKLNSSFHQLQSTPNREISREAMEVYYNNHWITVTEKLLEWLLLEREIFQVRVKTQEKIYFSSKQKINVHLTGKLKKGMNKKKVFSTLSDNMTEMESTCCASNLEDTNFKNNETKSAKKIFKKRQKLFIVSKNRQPLLIISKNRYYNSSSYLKIDNNSSSYLKIDNNLLSSLADSEC